MQPDQLSVLSDSRANNNWQTNYASITKSNENSSQTTKKQRDIGETARDSLAYSCLLKNELLGNGIEDVKTVADDRNENVSCSAKRGLFKYQSPTKQVRSLFRCKTYICSVMSILRTHSSVIRSFDDKLLRKRFFNKKE